MKITFGRRGILQLDDVRLVYRNFEGRGDKYNRQGDRNFGVIIDSEEAAETLLSNGWNVKIKPPREEGDTPFMYLPVKVKFNERGPVVWLVSGRRRRQLTEETVGILDKIDIAGVDMDLRPFDWEVNGKTGRTAYLDLIEVVQEIDRFTARYAEEEYPED